VTDLGKYISEELTTRLFLTGKFKVVERNMIDKVLDELSFSYQDMVDQESVQKLGKFLGVDAIATGTITDLPDYFSINARILDIGKASVISAAKINIKKDKNAKKLFDQVSTNSSVYSKFGKYCIVRVESPRNCDDGNPCTDDICNEERDNCDHINNKQPCDDGLYCTVNEICQGGYCISETARNCDDANYCTNDICDEDKDQCINNPIFIDADADGFKDSTCGGNDCDDKDPSIHPEATEVCGNRIDENCDGSDDRCSRANGGKGDSGSSGNKSGCGSCTISSQDFSSWAIILNGIIWIIPVPAIMFLRFIRKLPGLIISKNITRVTTRMKNI
jgi:TolB-like protein